MLSDYFKVSAAFYANIRLMRVMSPDLQFPDCMSNIGSNISYFYVWTKSVQRQCIWGSHRVFARLRVAKEDFMMIYCTIKYSIHKMCSVITCYAGTSMSLFSFGASREILKATSSVSYFTLMHCTSFQVSFEKYMLTPGAFIVTWMCRAKCLAKHFCITAASNLQQLEVSVVVSLKQTHAESWLGSCANFDWLARFGWESPCG